MRVDGFNYIFILFIVIFVILNFANTCTRNRTHLNTIVWMQSAQSMEWRHTIVCVASLPPNCRSTWMHNRHENIVWTFPLHRTNCTDQLCTNWSQAVSHWGKTLFFVVQFLPDTHTWRPQNSMQMVKQCCCANFCVTYCSSCRLSMHPNPSQRPMQLGTIVLPTRARNRQRLSANHDFLNASAYLQRLRIAYLYWLIGHNRQRSSMSDLHGTPIRLFGSVWMPVKRKMAHIIQWSMEKKNCIVGTHRAPRTRYI